MAKGGSPFPSSPVTLPSLSPSSLPGSVWSLLLAAFSWVGVRASGREFGEVPHTRLTDASADPQWVPTTSVSFLPTDEEPSPSPAEGLAQSGVLTFEGQMLPGDLCLGL